MNPLIWITESSHGDPDMDRETIYLGYAAEEASKMYAQWFHDEYWPYNQNSEWYDEPILAVLIFEDIDGRPQLKVASQEWHEAYWAEWKRQRAERKVQ